MCDCYAGKCEMCGHLISLHVADFCTERENVHPYCISCTRKMAKKHKKGKKGEWPETINGQKVFVDNTAKKRQENREPILTGNGDREVIILCDDHKAYGIHLN